MKITEYPKETVLNPTDVFLIDGGGGTRSVEAQNLLYELVDNIPSWAISGGSKRSIVRGKFLGTSPSDEQLSNIRNRSYKGLFLGDYWKGSDNIIWRIADFEYWIAIGDTSDFKGHVVIVPDQKLGNVDLMNDTATTEGGYANSKMRTSGLDQAKEMIFNAFGEENIYKHRENLSSEVSEGVVTLDSWYDSTVELMNEPMVFGCHFNNVMSAKGLYTNDKPSSTTQLSLFRNCRYYINSNRLGYWLRDVASTTAFSSVDYRGTASRNSANTKMAIRPVFGLC